MQYVYNFLGYDIKEQLSLMLYALILGALLGAVFDILRITRVIVAYRGGAEISSGLRRCVFVLCLIEDIAFAVISAIVLVLFCFKANGGTSRGYILFGALVGFALYLETLGRLTSLVSKAVAKLFYRVLALIKAHIIVPSAAFLKKASRRLYKQTIGRAASLILRRVYTRRTKKASRELTRVISRLYINKRKDTEDEAISYANAGEARRVRGLHNIDSHPRHSTDRVQSA